MISDWSVQFDLTSALYDALPLQFNVANGVDGYYYMLRGEACKLTNQVRATKNDIPQADGAILHQRFVAGMEIQLAIQLWQDTATYACSSVRTEMLDRLMGYLYNLINAGDNEGRLSWIATGQASDRMLDDLRLLTYPEVSQVEGNVGVEVLVTLDTVYPYEMDLTQISEALDASTDLDVEGNRPTYPVITLDGPFSTVTMVNTTTGQVWAYDDSRPGAPTIGGGDTIEINMFRNTAYKNATGANCKPGIDPESSEFFPLIQGTTNQITLDNGVTGTILYNNAWA